MQKQSHFWTDCKAQNNIQDYCTSVKWQAILECNWTSQFLFDCDHPLFWTWHWLFQDTFYKLSASSIDFSERLAVELRSKLIKDKIHNI